jgi:hypothetical protein
MLKKTSKIRERKGRHYFKANIFNSLVTLQLHALKNNFKNNAMAPGGLNEA